MKNLNFIEVNAPEVSVHESQLNTEVYNVNACDIGVNNFSYREIALITHADRFVD